MLTRVQVPPHPVRIVTTWPAAICCCTVGCPAHARDTVVVVVPPLLTSTWSSLRAVVKVNEALVGPEPLKLTLLVRNPAHGPLRYQALVPQSITPLGYWPGVS